MAQYDITILTDDRYVNPQNPDWYVSNILKEDGLVKTALENTGFKVTRKSWSDPEFDWSNTKAVLFRTTWDYFDRYAEWKAWLEKTSKVTQMINPFSTIQWNMDKHYLGDLKKKGVNIPETLYLERGTQTTLVDLLKETGWNDCILKPCISGAARHTYKLNQNNISEHEATFQQLIAEEAFMLQPFQKNVVEKGEVSLMVMGGQFTHAVLKVAKPGDFRVQDDFGGTVHEYTPNKEEIAFAEKAVAACSPQPFYARVDVIRDNNDELAVIEMELIEPELWFRMKPEAADVLAVSIKL
ncbi:ATP-grasp domain-containing protein [Roseivirga pacifica]|uniref:ATP-grasp domain-containing protein n=1 Tax=Roseivirga pacifica TaxID=1267423 RepID=UPI003BAE259A